MRERNTLTPQDKHNQYIIDKINAELDGHRADMWDRVVGYTAVIGGIVWLVSIFF
jgi:hypothetical protein